MRVPFLDLEAAYLELKDEICGPLLTKTAFDHGLLIIYANNDTSVCQFLPPLIIEEEQVDDIIWKLDQSLASARKLRPLAKAKNVFDDLMLSIMKTLNRS